MSAAEVAERRRLHQELDRACVELDLDGLRFVALVARIRAMSADELEKLRGLLREQHPGEQHGKTGLAPKGGQAVRGA